MKKETPIKSALSVVVGKNIKAARIKVGITQGQLAQELGVEIETVSRYERGAREPSFSQIERLCTVLGVAPAALFSDGTERPDVLAIAISDTLSALEPQQVNFVLDFSRHFAQFVRGRGNEDGIQGD